MEPRSHQHVGVPYSLADSGEIRPCLCLQAAEASARLADINSKMGNASMAASAFHQQLPCIAAAGPLAVRAKVLSAMADALLVRASEADVQKHRDM